MLPFRKGASERGGRGIEGFRFEGGGDFERGASKLNTKKKKKKTEKNGKNTKKNKRNKKQRRERGLQG